MDKIVLKITDVEAVFGINIKRNTTALGLDTASTTGYCIAKANTTKLYLDIGYFKTDVSNIENSDERDLLRYGLVYKNLHGIINKDYITVIENVYYGVNVKVTILLARIGAIAYAIAMEKGVENIIFKSAVQARKLLGIKGNCKKAEIVKQVNELLGINVKNDNEIDAIVLAIGGLKEE